MIDCARERKSVRVEARMIEVDGKWFVDYARLDSTGEASVGECRDALAAFCESQEVRETIMRKKP